MIKPGITPLAGNPLLSRADLQEAVQALWAPVAARLSPAGAGARLGHTGASFPDVAAGLEAFSRPLWGLVPLAAGGADVDWQPVLRGLAAGSDPRHAEFWGAAVDRDQRLVEMAAIGLALALVPEQVWDPLPGGARDRLAHWLSRINEVDTPDNNWLFFRVLVNEGLARVAAAGYDPAAQAAALRRLESFYLGDGWYCDGRYSDGRYSGGPDSHGSAGRGDYYIPWALHFYGLIYARLAAGRDADRAARFADRAATFAHEYAHWFADDGAAVPFGRSLTYRFAQAAFWGALAFADVPALPWGEIKGLALRHLRWWSAQPVTDDAGLLSIGYGYPNLNMAEAYNSPGSPYWAMKFFLPLALPQAHPFWRTPEAPAPRLDAVRAQPHPGMILCRDATGGHVFALAGGQQGTGFRHGGEKYAKFAYSTAFGFSVPAGGSGLGEQAADSMLALSDDGVHWRVREAPEQTRLDGDVLWSRWWPWPDVEVETWLLPRLPWHVRVHRLHTGRTLRSAEGGWALDRTGDDPAQPLGTNRVGGRWAYAVYPAGGSGVLDLAGERSGEVVRPTPNTNLLHPRTVLPTLRGEHEPGEDALVCAVLGVTSAQAWTGAWEFPPTLDSVRELLPVRARAGLP